MFADASLSARIDRAEADLVGKLAEAVERREPAARAFVMPCAGGLSVFARRESPANKMIGIGFDGPIDPAELDAIESRHREVGEPVRVELSVLADPSVAPMLTSRGYVLHGFEHVLGRRLDDVREQAVSADLTIESGAQVDMAEWSEAATTAFLHADGTGRVADDTPARAAIERVLLDMAALPDWTRYLARIGGRSAGTGSVRFHDGLAGLGGAATLPDYRGRGIHAALLQRRLVDARAAGCDLAVVVTAPGSQSQANVMKRGFVLFYARAILIKPCDRV